MDQCDHASIIVETLIDSAEQTQQKPYYSFRCTSCGNVIPVQTNSDNPIESKLKGIATDLMYIQQLLAEIRSKVKWFSLHYNTATKTPDSNKKMSSFECMGETSN